MATGAQVIERHAPLLGLLPSTLERQVRAQRLAGQVPTGKSGGGALGSAHFEVQHLAAFLMGLAGPIPSDAPEAVVALATMPYRATSNPPRGALLPLPTFEDQLAHWISYIATELGNGHPADDPGFDPIRSMKIGLCLRPRHAIITIGPDGPGQTTIVYAADPGPTFAVRRVTILSGDLLMAVGALLLDSLEQINALACVQFLGATQPAKAGSPRQKNAEASAKRPRRVTSLV